MSVTPYGVGRKLFAEGGINWTTEPIRAALARPGYAPSYDVDSSISVIGAALATIDLQSKSVNAAGWVDSAPLFFPLPPVGVDLVHVILYRTSDGLLLVRIGFPKVITTTQTPLILIRSASSPGIFRL